MDDAEYVGHPNVDALRRILTISFWLVAVSAATTLGLDVDGLGTH